ncbi:Scr1 family TA system antitoxin-like transcriptional regulator [Nocardia sp. NPDC004604]|uniref:Scr1 family TA system antitoxin-like transcriptional regulator n=1 Tax=Nocardia sp. NPDC004604 TaxID=3157013 RepID=UPI0033BF1732
MTSRRTRISISRISLSVMVTSRSGERWQAPSFHPRPAAPWPQACNRLVSFQLTLLPGLLQASTYRRWLVESNDPAMSAVDAERRLELFV